MKAYQGLSSLSRWTCLCRQDDPHPSALPRQIRHVERVSGERTLQPAGVLPRGLVLASKEDARLGVNACGCHDRSHASELGAGRKPCLHQGPELPSQRTATWGRASHLRDPTGIVTTSVWAACNTLSESLYLCLAFQPDMCASLLSCVRLFAAS